MDAEKSISTPSKYFFKELLGNRIKPTNKRLDYGYIQKIYTITITNYKCRGY